MYVTARLSIILTLLGAATFAVPAQAGKPVRAGVAAPHNYMPKGGYVPDKETAIRIAVAVWIPIYGEANIRGERPYHATLKNGIWTVEGSLPKGWCGGVAIAEISKRDARILRVSHGK